MNLFGQMWFRPVKNEQGQFLYTELVGEIVGVIVKLKTDGTEQTFRMDPKIDAAPRPITWHEVETLKIGALCLLNGEPREIVRTFPHHGELWLAKVCNCNKPVHDDVCESKQAPTEHKYFEIRIRPL